MQKLETILEVHEQVSSIADKSKYIMELFLETKKYIPNDKSNEGTSEDAYMDKKTNKAKAKKAKKDIPNDGCKNING